MNLKLSLEDAFLDMELEQKDEILMDLARTYVERLEAALEHPADDKAIKEYGAELMKVLAELLMTPKARKAVANSIKEVVSDDAISFAERRARAGNRYTYSEQ